MLTITEITRNILNLKKDNLKNIVLKEFYENILDSALSYQRTEGEFCLLVDDQKVEFAEIVLQELSKDNYDFKRYVNDAYFEKDNYEIVIQYDLENSHKELDKKSKVG